MTMFRTLCFYFNLSETGNPVGIQTLSSEDYTIGHHSVKITDPQTLLWLNDTNHASESITPLVKISYDNDNDNNNDQEVNFTGTSYIHP